MPQRNTARKVEERLSIRANQTQKTILRQAADVKHMNISQFVLQTSLEAAERVLQEERLIVLPAEQFDWLMKKLEEPPKDLPNLRRLMSETPVWNA